MMTELIRRCFQEIAEENIPYLSQWYMDKPAVITDAGYNKLKRLQTILYRAICQFVENYEKYESIFYLDQKARKIVEICNEGKPGLPKNIYRPGTYRPDILFDTDGSLKICEIGGRFPLNGYLASGFSELIGMERFLKKESQLKKRAEYLRFLTALFDYWSPLVTNSSLPGRITVLKGVDRPCDIKYYIPFFRKLGIEVISLSPSEFEANPNIIENSAVINEFNQMEIESLSEHSIEILAQSNALNDLRTIFLIHDKRFLAILCDDEFQREFLDNSEREFFSGYLIPTYTYLQADFIEKARHEKEQWLLKHSLLGKSEKVYAGVHCSASEWEELYSSGSVRDMVLQPYIKQRRVKASIGDNHFCDYVTGTLLCLDNNFFGTGLFRTSSFEITNRKDDRKIAQCYSESYIYNENYDFTI